MTWDSEHGAQNDAQNDPPKLQCRRTRQVDRTRAVTWLRSPAHEDMRNSRLPARIHAFTSHRENPRSSDIFRRSQLARVSHTHSAKAATVDRRRTGDDTDIYVHVQLRRTRVQASPLDTHRRGSADRCEPATGHGRCDAAGLDDDDLRRGGWTAGGDQRCRTRHHAGACRGFDASGPDHAAEQGGHRLDHDHHGRSPDARNAGWPRRRTAYGPHSGRQRRRRSGNQGCPRAPITTG